MKHGASWFCLAQEQIINRNNQQIGRKYRSYSNNFISCYFKVGNNFTRRFMKYTCRYAKLCGWTKKMAMIWVKAYSMYTVHQKCCMGPELLQSQSSTVTISKLIFREAISKTLPIFLPDGTNRFQMLSQEIRMPNCIKFTRFKFEFIKRKCLSFGHFFCLTRVFDLLS